MYKNICPNTETMDLAEKGNIITSVGDTIKLQWKLHFFLFTISSYKTTHYIHFSNDQWNRFLVLK
jgi:hypothetical protein